MNVPSRENELEGGCEYYRRMHEQALTGRWPLDEAFEWAWSTHWILSAYCTRVVPTVSRRGDALSTLSDAHELPRRMRRRRKDGLCRPPVSFTVSHLLKLKLDKWCCNPHSSPSSAIRRQHARPQPDVSGMLCFISGSASRGASTLASRGYLRYTCNSVES